jgi:hypothetical protein
MNNVVSIHGSVLLLWLLCSVAPASADEAVTLDAPGETPADSSVSVRWTGPRERHDSIDLVEVNAPDGASPVVSRNLTVNPVHVRAPEKPGAYELRYVSYKARKTLGRRSLTVLPVTATVEAPATAVGGALISVTWTGPKNDYDSIGIVPAGAPDRQHPLKATYASGKSVRLNVPEAAGEYEIRYLTGRKRSTLASTKLTVTAADASIEPATAEAGAMFAVTWKGPANGYDHIAIARSSDAADRNYTTSGYVRKGKPLSLRAPMTAGEYELRYVTASSHSTLARAKLVVTPGKLEPGMIEVSAGEPTASAGEASGGAIEILLDASGSMLQRIGSQRRIDIAVQTLKSLTVDVIPKGTPFALRVFGREAASCQTALELPLRPLDAAVVNKQIETLEPQQNARTPIAASLQAVASDLRSAKGERLVIMITDGEETCGGDPVAAIQKLRKAGANVRVNIVGFAIDDANLAATFGLWSAAGGGAYFEARDAAGLSKALALAVRPAFEVVDASKRVVASGFAGDAPVQIMPGSYTVLLKAGKGSSRSVTVRAKETTAVQF